MYRDKSRLNKEGRAIFLILFFFIFPIGCRNKCGDMKAGGFRYEYDNGASSSSWDTIIFYHEDSEGNRKDGPTISGDVLEVECTDIDNDGSLEVIIQSGIYNSYKTILKVDNDSKKINVYHTKGLKIDYPAEGYRYL